jgi:tRNA pseudouridine32 synthase/23S rRNA pseudouridine746 synthase
LQPKADISKAEQFFTPFSRDVSAITLPGRFTFPFYYEPHPLSIAAVKELQDYLEKQTHWRHNFGLDPNRTELEVGKMFGVLVVQKPDGELGYLKAYSGKLADMDRPEGFVPDVLHLYEGDNYYQQGMDRVKEISRKIKALEKSDRYQALKTELKAALMQSENELEAQRETIRQARKSRKALLNKAKRELSLEQLMELEQEEVKASLYRKRQLKEIAAQWKQKKEALQSEFDEYHSSIVALREKRKNLSVNLQQEIFDNYRFLNSAGETKSLTDIFEVSATNPPPAGAGDCAAPKLLQFAFKHNLKPIAMAEFWWGASLKTKVRKHGQYYPACTGKCKPILAHMLKGMAVDPNPIIEYSGEGLTVEVVYEDDHLAVINKPAGLLSVPGKNVVDSVATRMRDMYPKATGPLIVHRLDQSTSGLMLIAKTDKVYKNLQRQFVSRKVKKRYVALLEGEISQTEGIINLPLRVDLDNRPNQMVCYEYGKPAQTEYKVVRIQNGQTRIHFFPITGRTHQLRVHAAHPSGLNAPIVGDTLYGNRAQRLHLHAESIEFMHPVSKEKMKVEVGAGF